MDYIFLKCEREFLIIIKRKYFRDQFCTSWIVGIKLLESSLNNSINFKEKYKLIKQNILQNFILENKNGEILKEKKKLSIFGISGNVLKKGTKI